MATWKPASPASLAAFTEMTSGLRHTEPRKMFGYVCVFAKGYLCIGTHEVGIVMRLPEVAREEFLKAYGASIFTPMANRPMREYVVVPPALYGEPELLKTWAVKSVNYVVSLPEKPAKKPAKTSVKPPAKASAKVLAKAPAKKPTKKSTLVKKSA